MVKVATAIKLADCWMLVIVGGGCSNISGPELEFSVGTTYFIIDPLADRAGVVKAQRLRAKHSSFITNTGYSPSVGASNSSASSTK